MDKTLFAILLGMAVALGTLAVPGVADPAPAVSPGAASLSHAAKARALWLAQQRAGAGAKAHAARVRAGR